MRYAGDTTSGSVSRKRPSNEPAMTGFYSLVVGGLVVWRLTHLLNAEDGPAGVLVRLRVWVGDGMLGDLLDCFNCLSLVLALPIAAWLASDWCDFALLWPALSGAACLLERATANVVAQPQSGVTEESDVLLR